MTFDSLESLLTLLSQVCTIAAHWLSSGVQGKYLVICSICKILSLCCDKAMRVEVGRVPPTVPSCYRCGVTVLLIPLILWTHRSLSVFPGRHGLCRPSWVLRSITLLRRRPPVLLLQIPGCFARMRSDSTASTMSTPTPARKRECVFHRCTVHLD